MGVAAERAKRNAKARDWYKKNRAERLVYNRAYATSHREQLSAYERLRRYHLDNDKFKRMLEEQGNVCAICKQSSDHWHIDHDHSCCHNKTSCCGLCIRGILCSRCNFGLGNFDDDAEVVAQAAEYLQSWNKRRDKLFGKATWRQRIYKRTGTPVTRQSQGLWQ
jgi:hypothetical protein